MDDPYAVLRSLPRAWWFPPIPGIRPGDETYTRYELDAQPRLAELDDGLDWLAAVAPVDEWSIVGEDADPVRPLTLEALRIVAPDLAMSKPLLALARQPALQRRIRSYTGCYLDVGDFSCSVSGAAGRLTHILSDQQWCRHWLIYTDRSFEAVLTTTEPLGFGLPPDWPPPPQPVPLDGSVDLEVCADSFGEFLLRFWVENELCFGDRTSELPLVGEYAESLIGSDSP